MKISFEKSTEASKAAEELERMKIADGEDLAELEKQNMEKMENIPDASGEAGADGIKEHGGSSCGGGRGCMGSRYCGVYTPR